MKPRRNFLTRPGAFALPIAIALGGPALVAAEPGAASVVEPGAPAAPAGVTGRYAGPWQSSTDAAGELRLSVKQDEARAWTAEATFTLEGVEVPTKVKAFEVEGTKVRLVLDWVIDGTAGQSKLVGALKENVLQGTYETSGAAGSSHGTWSVTRR